MRTLTLFLAISFVAIYHSSNCQIQWQTDFKLAKSIAAGQDKLLVIDFWANWCGPCKLMDMYMWNDSTITQYSEKFVFVKINLDQNRGLAKKYQIRSIPLVIIADASGEAIWQKTGYNSSFADIYNTVFQSVPDKLRGLNRHALLAQDNSENAVFHLKLATAYQKSAKLITYKPMKDAFLRRSNSHFSLSAKYTQDETIIEYSELNKTLNAAYLGFPKKALKKLSKVESTTSEKSEALKQFIEAYCYKCTGDQKRFETLITYISNPKHLKELKEL